MGRNQSGVRCTEYYFRARYENFFVQPNGKVEFSTGKRTGYYDKIQSKEVGEKVMKTKIILVVLVIAATLTECIAMRKSREYDAADNIAGLERCVKAMVVLGFVGIAAAVAFVAM